MLTHNKALTSARDQFISMHHMVCT